jgi:prepilin-type processing-associated H-X9-DG protein
MSSFVANAAFFDGNVMGAITVQADSAVASVNDNVLGCNRTTGVDRLKRKSVGARVAKGRTLHH